MNVPRILPIARPHRNPTASMRPRTATVLHLNTPRTRALNSIAHLRNMARPTKRDLEEAQLCTLTAHICVGVVEQGAISGELEAEAERLYQRIRKACEKVTGKGYVLRYFPEPGAPAAVVVDLAAYRVSRGVS